LPIEGDWLKEASIGDVVVFKDARKSNREIKLVDRTDDGFWGELFQTAYITPNTELKLLMVRKYNHSKYLPQVGRVGKLPNLQKMIFLHKGDFLILNKKICHANQQSIQKTVNLLHMPQSHVLFQKYFRW